MRDDDFDDEYVGYRHPPRATRFQKGRSGNPKGRPPRKDMIQTFIDVANEEVTVDMGGEKVVMTKKEAVIQRLINDSMKGKSEATKNLIIMLRMLTDDMPAI